MSHNVIGMQHECYNKGGRRVDGILAAVVYPFPSLPAFKMAFLLFSEGHSLIK